jgi:hypothetical protein
MTLLLASNVALMTRIADKWRARLSKTPAQRFFRGLIRLATKVRESKRPYQEVLPPMKDPAEYMKKLASLSKPDKMKRYVAIKESIRNRMAKVYQGLLNFNALVFKSPT